MRKIIVCLVFLISFSNAIQCYNGKTYVDIPESKLLDIGYTKYNITHSNFDCKFAYKRYLKVKEIQPVNVSQVIKEKNELEEPSKICSFLPIFLLVIIVGVILIVKIILSEEPQDDWDLVVQKEPIKPKNVVKTEPSKSWDDLSKEFSENLRKIEQERLKNDYPVKLAQKIDKTYEELLSRKEWYNFRKKVIYDRGYICEFCKKKHNLQVHHKLYYKKPNKEKIEPWLYNMEEVLLLCDNCHKLAHKKNRIKVYYISYADYNNRKVGFYNQN